MHKLWRTKSPNTYHMEYGYSTMGYEIAAGLGIKMADPSREVYVLVGDGSYLMMAQEIATSIQEGAKLNIVVVDNHGFASIGGLSEACGSAGFGTEYRCRTNGQLGGNPVGVDFVENARSLGAEACRAGGRGRPRRGASRNARPRAHQCGRGGDGPERARAEFTSLGGTFRSPKSRMCRQSVRRAPSGWQDARRNATICSASGQAAGTAAHPVAGRKIDRSACNDSLVLRLHAVGGGNFVRLHPARPDDNLGRLFPGRPQPDCVGHCRFADADQSVDGAPDRLERGCLQAHNRGNCVGNDRSAGHGRHGALFSAPVSEDGDCRPFRSISPDASTDQPA